MPPVTALPRTFTVHSAPRRRLALLGPALGLLLACASCRLQAYEEAPLPGAEEIDTLLRERAALVLPTAHASTDPVGESSATSEPTQGQRLSELLLERSPRVRSVLARYRAARARSDEPTPWPNPSLILGPLLGYGTDAGSPHLVPQVGVGFAVPLGDRLEREDERNLAAAELAWIEAGADLRGAYLELREALLQLHLLRARLAVQRSIEAAAGRSRDTARRLVDAGEVHALGLTQFQLEHAREVARTLEVQGALEAAEQRLATLLAVDVAALGALDLPLADPLLADLPDLEDLRATQLGAHPDLAVARARHALADRQLRLELARQVPDLSLDLFDQTQPGEQSHQLSLTLALALPLFDRNQGPIAAARGEREATRVDFEGVLHGALSDLEGALRALRLSQQRLRVLHERVLPAAQENLEVARLSMTAGTAGAIDVLDAERSLRQVEVETIEARLGVQRAWSELEKAVGAPLLELGMPVPELVDESRGTDPAAGPEGEEQRDV